MNESFTGAEKDVLIALHRRGPLEDGDIPSKDGRNSLCDRGMVAYDNGINCLTKSGKSAAQQFDEAVGHAGEASMSCIRCGGALVDSGIFCPKCRAVEDELEQLRERNERVSRQAHSATHELEVLRHKYRVLEHDRNNLLQQLRERDARIATLRAERREGKTNGRRHQQA